MRASKLYHFPSTIQPRFTLTEQWDLNCLGHRGYFVDHSQDVGTLYGLSNMLVLNYRSGAGHKRRLILPVGPILPSSNGNTHPKLLSAFSPIRRQLNTTFMKLMILSDASMILRSSVGSIGSIYTLSRRINYSILCCSTRGQRKLCKGWPKGRHFPSRSFLPKRSACSKKLVDSRQYGPFTRRKSTHWK